MKQNQSQTRQFVLNKLYNQDIAPEDSQITSFYYHKTLALQFLIATFSLCSLVLSLLAYMYKSNLSPQIIKRLYNLLMVFSTLGIIAIILKKISQIKWIKQKKQKNINIKSQVFTLLLQVFLYIPCPMTYTDQTFEIITYSFDTVQLNYNSFISFYLLFNRFVYIITFLIHSQLFYGSRPDRLSRLYTVKFGTFNAIKFLINQRPGSVIKVTFSFNFVILPFAILLIEGQINKYLSSFHSCLYFVVVTQATVGYGDIVPASIFGRFVTLMIIMAGVSNTALLLILFMRLMELRGQQQQSLYLLQSLQKKVNLTRSRVFRIQNQWIYSNMRCPPQHRDKKQQQIKAIRYNLRRNIMLDRAGPINVKRMMLSNFSQIMQNINLIQQKNNIIAKCIEVIKSSDIGDRKQDKQINTKQINLKQVNMNVNVKSNLKNKDSQTNVLQNKQNIYVRVSQPSKNQKIQNNNNNNNNNNVDKNRNVSNHVTKGQKILNKINYLQVKTGKQKIKAHQQFDVFLYDN